MALQLLLDRLLKQMLAVRADCMRRRQVVTMNKLTPMESNAVWYMAGYVALRLLKQFKKPTQNPEIEKK